MTKTYYFNKNTKNNIYGKFFLNNNGKSYSEILDDIITADVIDKNSYLFTSASSYNTSLIDDEPITLTGSKLKADDSFIKAAKFLANYKKNKTIYKIPFIYGKMYTLSDGTPIVFYDDEIQIGFDTYKYGDFNSYAFLSSLTAPKKELIINIFTNGIDNVKINIL